MYDVKWTMDIRWGLGNYFVRSLTILRRKSGGAPVVTSYEASAMYTTRIRTRG